MAAFEQIVLYTGIACEAILIGILWRRGYLRRMPFFSGYMISGVVIDLSAAFFIHGSSATYFDYYLVEYIADALIQFLVLLELARGVLRPLPELISRGGALFLIVITVAEGALLWHFSAYWVHRPWPADWLLLIRVQLVASLLRVLFLLLLGWLIQFLNRHFIPIGWGELELQVATGIGFYALVSFGVAMALRYPVSLRVYHAIDLVSGVSFFAVVVYWIFSFLRPEQPFFVVGQETGGASEDSDPEVKRNLQSTPFQVRGWHGATRPKSEP